VEGRPIRTRRRAWRRVTLAVVAGLVAVGGLGPGANEPHAQERPEVGSFAPDFVLPDLNGTRVRLSDFRSKKAVFLNFWASWCPSCQEEMPTMEKLYQEFKPRGLEILAVSIDRVKAEVAKFTKMHGVTFPALLDPNRKVFHTYRVSSIPTHYLIDASQRHTGRKMPRAPRVAPTPVGSLYSSPLTPYGLIMSTTTATAGIVPLFSAQCVTSFPSAQLSPSRYSFTWPPSLM